MVRARTVLIYALTFATFALSLVVGSLPSGRWGRHDKGHPRRDTALMTSHFLDATGSVPAVVTPTPGPARVLHVATPVSAATDDLRR
jgi:hypothetical protein